MAQPSHRQQRARRLLEQHPRVVGGHAFRVDEHLVLVLLTRLVLAVGHAVGGDRGGDVHHHARIAAERETECQRVGGEHRLRAAKGRHTGRIGVGTGNQHQQVVLQGAHEIHGQTGDMVAAPDDQRGRAQLARSRGQRVQGLVHEPGPGQALTIPQQSGGTVGHHLGCALSLHAAGFEFLHVTCQQLQAVGVVSQQVALHQGGGHAIGLRGPHPGTLQQGAGKRHQRVGSVQRGRGGHAGSPVVMYPPGRRGASAAFRPTPSPA